MIEVVTDPDDARIATFVGLRDHALRIQREGESGDLAGLFVAEGDLVVERALRAGFELQSVLIAAARTKPLPRNVPADAKVYGADATVLQRITGYHLHRGMLACFRRRPVPSPMSVLRGARRVVVLEGVNNPVNLGLVARSAAGLGLDAMLLDPTCCDPLYRRAARVSMGEVYSFPYARLDPLPHGLVSLREHGFTLVALTPDPRATPIDRIAPSSDERIALVLGAEGPGLSTETLASIDRWACIPMHRNVDSLNIGVAAGIACYVLGR